MGRRRDGKVLLGEALGVVFEEEAHALRLRGADDEAGMMMFLHAEDDFGSVEHEGVGIGGFGEAEDAAGVFLARGREGVRLAAQAAISRRAHSGQRLTPVEVATRSAMKAPPTRAAISRK